MEYKAKHYKDNYKTKKEELARILFEMFNENVFESKLDANLPIIWSQTLNKTAGYFFFFENLLQTFQFVFYLKFNDRSRFTEGPIVKQ